MDNEDNEDAQRTDEDLSDELLFRKDEHEELIAKLSELNTLKESGEYDDIEEHIQNAEEAYTACQERIDALIDLLEERGVCTDDALRDTSMDVTMDPSIVEAVEAEMENRPKKRIKFETVPDSNEVDVLQECDLKDAEEMKIIEAEEKSGMVIRHFTGQNGALVQSTAVHDSADIQLEDITAKLPLKVHQSRVVKRALHALTVLRLGFLIAHEMGLGKTLSAIAIVCDIMQKAADMTIVISCPISLIDNWCNEFQIWVPSFTVMAMKQLNASLLSAWKRKGGILIVGHDNYATNQDKYNPDMLVLDEAHICKNKNTNLYKAVSAQKDNKVLLLTGTPLQNNLMEFYAMLSLIHPKLIDMSDFHKNFKRPIEKGLIGGSTDEEIAHGKIQLEVLLEVMKDVMDRKTSLLLKLSLPIDLHEYKLAYRVPPNFNDIVDSEIEKQNQTGTSNGYELNVNYKTMTLSKKEKLEALKMILKAYSTKKVLVFSPCIEALEYFAQNLPNGRMMCGTTSIKDRQALVNEFQEVDGKSSTFNILFLSTKVGGMGLNLIKASLVVIADPSWNPANDRQASFRAFRYGQEQDVTIIRLIAHKTIQNKLYRLAAHKDMCSARLISHGLDPEKQQSADGSTLEFAQQQPQVRHYTAKQIKNRDEYEDDDDSIQTSPDSHLNKLIKSPQFKSVFVSCSDRTVLFDSGDKETLDEQEKAEAENGINKYMARQEFRSVVHNDINYKIPSNCLNITEYYKQPGSEALGDDFIIPFGANGSDAIIRPLTPYYEIMENGKIGWYFGNNYGPCKIQIRQKGKKDPMQSMQYAVAVDEINPFILKGTIQGKSFMYKVMYGGGVESEWSEYSAAFYARK
jgi:SNF2 family DNA or RNA helicase